MRWVFDWLNNCKSDCEFTDWVYWRNKGKKPWQINRKYKAFGKKNER
jgi:hypothetical protein